MTPTSSSAPSDSPFSSTPLPALLADLVHVQLLAKHAHWNVTGPTFGSLHLGLDELATFVAAAADSVAERLRSLGRYADGQLACVSTSVVPALPAGALRDDDVITAMVAVLDVVSASVGRAVDELADDPVSLDLLVGIAGGLDKRRWLLRAHQ